ncbi:MAG: SusC/RagA family protein [Cytophagaceae bacterium]|nr:SusC/RagA family protein [Cytophagaceae bacterium]
MKKILLPLVALFICVVSYGQHTISGTVTSVEDGTPLPGVTVLVAGSTNGTSTDFDGKYSLENISPTATLILSFVGFKTVELPVEGKSSLDVALELSSQELDAVVLTGYTAQKRADITGAVAVVDVEELDKQPEPNPIKALQGRVAGVQINADASPSGGGTSINIRGIGTLNNTSPLFVIDGVPTKAGMHELNPNDIESIQVLKDASSASIYGSRASNGVIIITTKQGKVGKMQINFKTYMSTSNYTNRQDVLNAEQFGQVLWQANINDGLDPNNNNLRYQFDYTGTGEGAVLNEVIIPEFLDEEQTLRAADTDWFDEVSRSGFVQSYDLAVSNGSEKGTYLFSLGYYDNEGIIKYSNFNRISTRLNSSYNFYDGRLKVGENITLNRTNELVSPQVLDPALKALPIVPVRTVDGEGWGGPVGGMNDRQNPVRLLVDNSNNDYEYYRVFGNVFADAEPIENLHLRTSFGIDYNNYYQRALQLSYSSGYLRNDQNAVTINQNTNLKTTWSNTLTYDITLGKHELKGLAGIEMYEENYRSASSRNEDFIIETPEYMYPDAATGEAYSTGGATAYSLLSYFGKLDYTYDDKYLVSATLRRDGSSRFGKNNRFGTFPAFSAGWRISNESFLQDVPFVSNLMLRAGWGQTGNQEIANNAIYSLYISDYSGGDPTWNSAWGTAYDLSGSGSGLLPSGFKGIQIGNDDLKWETTTQTNIGLDFSLMNQEIYGEVNYYFKETEDILVLPPYLGAIGEGGNRWVNGVSLENKGFEFALGYRHTTKWGLGIDINANVSTNENKVTFLPVEVQNNYGGNGSDDNILGRPLNSMYGYIADGLFKTQGELDNSAEQEGKGLGRIRYRDIDGDGVITDDDRTWIGEPYPDFSYGLNIVLDYKGFDFTMFWQGIGKTDVINGRKGQTDFWSIDDIGSNKGTRLLNAWSPDNPNSTIPALTTIDRNAENRFSTYFVENGAYLKLRNLQVGYTLPNSLLDQINVSSLRLYTSGQNLFTISSSEFTGVDPENPGFGYPLPLTITMGLNLTL